MFPQTYMNRSGEAVYNVIHYFKIKLEDCIVIYDDIDLKTGKYKYKLKGSAGTHNGMRSIINKLKTENIQRLRIGIGRPPENMNLSDYVLNIFEKKEKEQIYNTIEDVIKYIMNKLIK